MGNSESSNGTKEGWLDKFAVGRSALGRKNWQRRYFVVDRHAVRYGKDEAATKNPKTCKAIPILHSATNTAVVLHRDVHERTHPEAKEAQFFYFAVEFVEGGKPLMLLMRTRFDSERQEWIEFFSLAISVAQGKPMVEATEQYEMLKGTSGPHTPEPEPEAKAEEVEGAEETGGDGAEAQPQPVAEPTDEAVAGVAGEGDGNIYLAAGATAPDAGAITMEAEEEVVAVAEAEAAQPPDARCSPEAGSGVEGSPDGSPDVPPPAPDGEAEPAAEPEGPSDGGEASPTGDDTPVVEDTANIANAQEEAASAEPMAPEPAAAPAADSPSHDPMPPDSLHNVSFFVKPAQQLRPLPTLREVSVRFNVSMEDIVRFNPTFAATRDNDLEVPQGTEVFVVAEDGWNLHDVSVRYNIQPRKLKFLNTAAGFGDWPDSRRLPSDKLRLVVWSSNVSNWADGFVVDADKEPEGGAPDATPQEQEQE